MNPLIPFLLVCAAIGLIISSKPKGGDTLENNDTGGDRSSTGSKPHKRSGKPNGSGGVTINFFGKEIDENGNIQQTKPLTTSDGNRDDNPGEQDPPPSDSIDETVGGDE